MKPISKALWMARVNEGSHSFTCHPQSHTLLHKCNELFCLYSQPQSITALWPVLICRISRSTEGRRLSWLRWLVTCRGYNNNNNNNIHICIAPYGRNFRGAKCPPEDGHPTQYHRPTVRRPGIDQTHDH